MKCEECKWDYPQHFLNILRSNLATENGKAICGICALRITNEIHGLSRKRFHGRAAEYLRLQAESWRKKHSYDAPKEEKK